MFLHISFISSADSKPFYWGTLYMLRVFKHIENQVKQNIFNKTKLEWLHRFSMTFMIHHWFKRYNIKLMAIYDDLSVIQIKDCL